MSEVLPRKISAKDAITQIHSGHFAAIDVRSEGEVLQGSIPGFANFPIIDNDERHKIGLEYKQKGQNAALELAYSLVEPHRAQRILQWLEYTGSLDAKAAIVACWRGGLRSEIACESIREGGFEALQVTGGYKEIRRELQACLSQVPELLVLSGMTGSGKTKLIEELQVTNKIDLENLAEHRGSSFGQIPHKLTQPSTATFENRIGLKLFHLVKDYPLLIEDESQSIGNVSLPRLLLKAMREGKLVVLETPIEERVREICKDYIETPILNGIACSQLQKYTIESLNRIRNKLGGLLTDQLIAKANQAFASKSAGYLQHSEWITTLLRQYYDRLYSHSMSRWQRNIVYRGDYNGCSQWIWNQFG